jgi:hypothetical protein
MNKSYKRQNSDIGSAQNETIKGEVSKALEDMDDVTAANA